MSWKPAAHALLLSLLLVSPAFAGGPAGPELFRLRPEAAGPRIVERPEVLRAWAADVRFDALKSSALELPLPGGGPYRAVRTDLERHGDSSFAWRGKLLDPDGVEAGQATLTVLDGRMRGALFLPGAVYEIEPAADGSHRLVEVDPDALAPCAVGRVPEAPVDGGPQAALAPLAAPPLPARRRPRPSADPVTRIDLLVLYTPDAEAFLPPSSPIRLDVQSSVDLANTAFRDSRINLRLNLIGVRKVGYTETGIPQEDLRWLSTDPGVARLRQQTRAGLVSLYVDRMEEFCGYAQIIGPAEVARGTLPDAYSVVRRVCGVASLILAHEIGHNLGGQHDPENALPPAYVAFPFAYGHYVDGKFRTIMSYADPCTMGCPLIPIFSHPGITHDGLPAGVAGRRDNHRMFNLSKGFFAGAAPPAAGRPGPDHLCLLGGRFQVRVDWENPFDGSFGVARAVPRTNAAGFFSFGDPANLELLVKMLDFGDTVKLFYGQLTNLGFTLTVTDTRTGIVRSYENGPDDCGAIDPAAFPPARALGRSVAAEPSAGPPEAASGGACRTGGPGLCLLGRFQVEVDWHNPGNGQGGRGSAVALSGQTGAFYFTDAGNLELTAKVVDFGERIDFFYGSLSDLEYTIRVTDTATGLSRTYRNPAGTFCGGLDVGAF
jgi:peptidyl-Asp metalloendopeptidase